MKKVIVLGIITILSQELFSQPSQFTWDSRHNGFYYVSAAKDQKEQGPCGIFATVAAVEAITQIYYNKTQNIDLSESNIYSGSSNCFGFGCSTACASTLESLNFFSTEGVVNESCFPFPTSFPWCRQDCQNICTNPLYKITIPSFEQLALTSATQLKYKLIDNGPIIVSLANVGHVLHPGTSTGVNHTVLIIGWRTVASTTEWYIKDSWPNSPSLYYKNINLFNFSPSFYSVKYTSGVTAIGCSGTGCSAITTRSYYDYDQDGFFNWGIGSRPNGCTGPGKMDYNDNDDSIICLNNSYMPQNKPAISGSDFVCQTGTSRTFTLNNLPQGFTATWSVSPTAYFNAPLSGSGTTATINPKSDIGKQCTLKYTITDGIGTASYSKSFTINGPGTNQVNVSVEDANGGTPMYVNGIWLLCPNKTYYLHINNNSGCSTTGYNWTLPSGWTKYWQSGNTVAIYTNSNPTGTAYIYATTCCGYYLIKTQHFSSGGNCYKSTSDSSMEVDSTQLSEELNISLQEDISALRVFPNPTSAEVTISLLDDADAVESEMSIEIFDNNSKLIFSSQVKEKQTTIQTDKWKEGLYYVRVKHNGQYFNAKLNIVKAN